MSRIAKQLNLFLFCCLAVALLSCREAPDTAPVAPDPPSIVAPPSPPTPKVVSPPGRFIANRGQLDDEVIYYFRGRRGSVFLTAGGVVFDFVRERAEPAEEAGRKDFSDRPPEGEAEKIYERLSFRMDFAGLDPGVEIVGEEELPGRVSYFRGSDPDGWRSGIPTFAAVAYRNAWPGIDLVFRLEGGNLRWRVSVAPGADAEAIAFRYQGVDGLAVGAGGELRVDTAFGVFVEPPLTLRQEGDGAEEAIGGGWKLVNEKTAAIDIGGFEPGFGLIIER